MPISDCEVRDPRIRRTRELLRGALQTLLERNSLDEILVQDITDAATVNRATFYDHYTDKFALFEAMVAGGFHKLLHERDVHYDGTCPLALNAVVLVACDYLTQTHLKGVSAPYLDAAITAAIRRVLFAGLPKRGAGSHLSPEITAGAASSAIYGAIKEWLQLPRRPAPEKIAPAIVELILPMLPPAAASRRA